MPDQADHTEDNAAETTPENAGPETTPRADDLDVARAEAADWRDKYLRKLAEFDNYRKRTRQENEYLWQRATEAFIVTLLPVLDDFDRMLADTSDPDNLYRKGAEMIRGKLKSILDGAGVVKFESTGKPFDPERHDAIMMQPTPGFPPGTVLNEVTPGYAMGDKIIRHAQVVVSAEAEPES